MTKKCPNCGHEMSSKTHHESGDKMMHCNNCGHEIMADEDEEE